MTILFFTRLFYPHIGGVEKHVIEISKLLIKDGYKIIVITEEIPTETNIVPQSVFEKSWLKQNPLTNEIKNGITVYRILIPPGTTEKQKKFIIWKWLWKHRKLIEKADIIHCHDVFFWYLPFRFLYPKKPVYTTFHGYETGRNIKTIQPKTMIIRKMSEFLSWGNMCVGKFITKWYRTKPTYITYGGAHRIKNNNPITIHNKKIVIAFVGRLEADTGIPIYLQALDILKKEKINFIFLAYGDGNLRKECEVYGKVYGFIENVQEKVLQADIVFASSYLSILDALSLKKPVFAAYNSPLKKDYLSLTPFSKWIWIASDAKKLAEQVTYYRDHKEKYNTRITEAYTWARMQTWEKVKYIYYELWKKKV